MLVTLLAFYPVRQLFVQMVLLHAPFAIRGGKLDVAIATERNVGMGALEAATYLATALAIAQLTQLSSYDDFARAITEDGLITDPWIDGAPRFREEPIVLDAHVWKTMRDAAEDVASVYDEMCQLISEDPNALERFFAMTPLQRAMWACSQPLWHGLARADLFFTEDGISIAELNCDTPTGEAEAIVLGRIAKQRDAHFEDPNAELEASYGAMLDVMCKREARSRSARLRHRVPDRVHRRSLRHFVSTNGLGGGARVSRRARVALFFGRSNDDALMLFDDRIDVMIRHYRTDWWGERVSAWDDEDLADTEPLEGPLGAALECALDRRVVVVNPFGAVVPQNKRAMAFMWEHIHRFSPRAQSIIEKYVPVTSRAESVHQEQLRAQKDQWVLKSDYGAEGEEVVVGKFTSQEIWLASIDHARKGHWVAQRFFEARASDGGEITNYGVYVIAGRAAGVYARAQKGATDASALSVPVLVKP